MRNELLNSSSSISNSGEKQKQGKRRLVCICVHIRLGCYPSCPHKLVLPASRGGFVGACRFKQGAVQRATLEEERGGLGFVSWDGETV